MTLCDMCTRRHFLRQSKYRTPSHTVLHQRDNPYSFKVALRCLPFSSTQHVFRVHGSFGEVAREVMGRKGWVELNWFNASAALTYVLVL